MRACFHVSGRSDSSSHATKPTSERRRSGDSSAVEARRTSSVASSSISVVSVPLDVTGEGPTMSLGLMMCILLDEMRWAELGRSEAESVAGGGEELLVVSREHCPWNI